MRNGRRVLRRGDDDDAVAAVQRLLNGSGASLDVDGAFGGGTERAVRAFQDRAGLALDGRVGPRTLAALEAAQATTPTAPATTVTPTAPTAMTANPLRASLGQGFQYVIGVDFAEGAAALAGAGARGTAILDGQGASPATLTALKDQGLRPLAYNNAFQTQPGEALPPGVRRLANDDQWGEVVPDFSDRRWQDRRIGEAKEAAVAGFEGLMLDNVPRAGGSAVAADYVKRMVDEARAASGNAGFGVVLQNGEELVAAHPWLVDDGYVQALQKEDVSFHVNGAGTSTGVPTSADDRAHNVETFTALRARHPALPLIAVDYPKDEAQAAQAQETARRLGFHVSHVATADGGLSRLSQRPSLVNALD